MIKNLHKIGFILATGLSLGSLNVSAQTFYEPFAGTGTIGGADATTAGASSNGWTTHSPTPSTTNPGTTGVIPIVEGSLNFSGLSASTGNKVLLPGTNSTVSRDVNADISGSIPAGTTTAYFSTLINVIDDTQLNTTGDYFMHFGNDIGATNTTLFARLFIKSSGSGYKLAIQNTSGGSNLVPTESPTELAFGTTYLVVVRYDIMSENDLATLWVNPTLGATEPTTGGVTNDVGNGAGPSSFKSINLRNGSGTPKAHIDEIRVGTTFAAVTPSTTTGIKDFAAGNLALYPNPTTGAIKLQLPASFAANGKYNLTVFKVTGEVLLKASGSEKALNNQLSSKFSNLTAGVYMVTIDGGGQSFQTKIIKN